jgi:hypothetical protein
LLVFGGSESEDTVSSTMYILDLVTASWTSVATPFKRESHKVSAPPTPHPLLQTVFDTSKPS